MATRTIGPLGGNWSANGTWVEGVAPTSSDDVVANVASGQVTVNTTTCVAKSVVLTGYTNTITFTSGQTLTVSGNVTLAGTIAGTGTLAINAASTMTANGKTLSGALSCNAGSAVAYTLADNWIVTGTVSTSNFAHTFTGNQITANGSLTIGTAGESGTTNFVLGGTGTFIASSAAMQSNVTINTAGTITLGNINYATGTFTYTAGTIVTGNTLTIRNNATFNTSGMNFNNVSINVTNITTVTLTSGFNCTGNLIVGGSAVSVTFSGAFNVACTNLVFGGSTTTLSGNITATGNLTFQQSTTLVGAFNVNIAGNYTSGNLSLTSTTTTLVFNGTGTLTFSSYIGALNLPISINTSGTITCGPLFVAGANTTVTIVAGTFDVTTNKSAFSNSSNFTWPPLSGTVAWSSVVFATGGSKTITLTSDLTLTGSIMALGDPISSAYVSTIVFSGAFDVTCDSINLLPGGKLQLPAGRTLTVNTQINVCGAVNTFVPLAPIFDTGGNLISGTPSSSINLKYLGTPANNRVFGGVFTDVDASLSTNPIINYNGGTLTRTTNIVNKSLPIEHAYTF